MGEKLEVDESFEGFWSNAHFFMCINLEKVKYIKSVYFKILKEFTQVVFVCESFNIFDEIKGGKMFYNYGQSLRGRRVITEVQWLDVFANNLVSLLQDARMTQRELADASGISEATISKYVNGQQMPQVKALVNICYALDIDIEELIPTDEMII